MNKTIKIFVSFLSSFVFLFCFFGIINAAAPLSSNMAGEIEDQMFTGVNYADTFDEGVTMSAMIATVIKAFLSLLGTIFVVLMLYGGFTWMTASGDESKVEKAKSTIQTAVIGLIIVVSAYSITYTVFKNL